MISKNLLMTQEKLLNQASKYIKKYGLLIYAVCSLQKEEGEDQITNFLNKTNNFEISKVTPNEIKIFETSICKEGWVRIFPFCLDNLGGNDGFFICRLRRIN